MAPPILVAGLDGRSLLLEAPVLQREKHIVEERPSARDLLDGVAPTGARLVVLGPRLDDLSLADTIRKIRTASATRHVSILALIPAPEPIELDRDVLKAGANAVLRRPLDPARLENWIAKLLAVPRRVEARVPVQGHVVGTPRIAGSAHFFGLTRNLSVNGMLLASPIRLTPGREIELEFHLPGAHPRLRALGRVVREAGEVAWPHIGYGIEFFFVPPESSEAIAAVVAQGAVQILPPRADTKSIHSTVRREAWVYEILEPKPYAEGWQAEIRRAPREMWRAGTAGPFYVVEGATREAALEEAREFLARVE
jgi:DNA-binding response OmpR family regulator